MKKIVLTLVCLVIMITFSGVASATPDICNTENPNVAYFDDHSDGMSGATSVNSRYSWTAGKLECPGDEDWFKISVPSSMKLKIRTYGSTDTFGELYKLVRFNWWGLSFSYLQPINNPFADDDASVGRNFGILEDVTSGVYYLKVKHYPYSVGTGPYYLEVRDGTIIL